jgi:peptidoglycan hydrolase-like protein with peptidoglycan-binding domain
MNNMKKLTTYFITLVAFCLLSTGTFAQAQTAATITTEKQLSKVRTEYAPATIEKAQQLLKAKGIYKGEITGKLDAATKEAIKTFQQQSDLTPTGRLNKDTREKLGVESNREISGEGSSTKSRSKKSPKTEEKLATKSQDK